MSEMQFYCDGNGCTVSHDCLRYIQNTVGVFWMKGVSGDGCRYFIHMSNNKPK